jgi:hypothetical protein
MEDTMDELNFTGIAESDQEKVRKAILRGENFHGYIPSESLDFIIRNYRLLAKLQVLEPEWLLAYEHASNFSLYSLEKIKAVFDACDRKRLLELKPIGAVPANGRLTLFRGCAGPVHSKGMSWTPSLDKAIWYAAHHAECYDLSNSAVYVATMQVTEIYCRLDRYDGDAGGEFVAHSDDFWRVNVPAGEFRLDRTR